jgi:AraC-like DNA-binding protein
VAAVAALLDSRPAVAALRRGLLKDGPGVVSCRGAAALRRTLNHRVVEAVVLAPRPGILQEFSSLRADFPAIPVIAYAAFRPDDGEVLARCHQHQVAAVVVEGVDDAVIGELVRRASLAAERHRALAHAPRLLRLTEPLQLGAWETLVERASQPTPTSHLAERLGVSREHLSRQFGAGGAPNLKRVIDFLRLVLAVQLLRNPGYTVTAVSGLLGFASPSHLGATARRVAGVGAGELGRLSPEALLGHFVHGHTRSRL